MIVWKLLTGNMFKKPHTRQPEALVPFPDKFRGNLLHDADLCTACETCVYVCSPSAITFDTSSPESATWQYQLLQCTYCGACVNYCPTHALSFESAPQPQVFHELKFVRHTIPYQSCPRCGEKVIPLPHAALVEKYGSPVTPEIEKFNRLCARCRKIVYSESIKRGFTGS